jgi:hypothetical protein
MTTDELIDGLRTRVVDAGRRVDVPQTRLGATVASMGLGDKFGMMRSLAGDLARVVDANNAGRSLDPDLIERAERLEASSTTPLHAQMPDVADQADLDRAEIALGQPLPSAVRRIYSEVADGGFGPGTGLLSLEALVATYRELIADPPAPRGLAWPPAMVPLVDVEPGYRCLELPAGRVIDWDPEETSEWQSAERWARSFQEIAPDIETWLGAWVVSRAPAEVRADAMTQLRREELRRTRERIAAMTPAEREAVGLPAVGWEAAFISEEDV